MQGVEALFDASVDATVAQLGCARAVSNGSLHYRFAFDGCESMLYEGRVTGVQATDSVARPTIPIDGP